MSGSASERVLVVTANARSLPALMYWMDEAMEPNTTCTRPVLDDELLAEPLRQRLPHKAGGDVHSTAGGEADDQAHGLRRIALGWPMRHA